ncbi:hypothetical protein RhiJN_08800 [Ceratobasidium sp. AG-Ba]|nr:hypothetical protein RhiJN_08800 [Ceratobasidium sp. AG-Ba]
MAQAEHVPLWGEYEVEEGKAKAASQDALGPVAKGRKQKGKKVQTAATSRGRILLVRALNNFSFEQNGKPFTPTLPVRSWTNVTLFGFAATLAVKAQNDFIATGYWDLKNHPVYNDFIKIHPTHIYIDTIEGFAGGKPVICIESLDYVYATLHPSASFANAWWRFVKGFTFKGRRAPVWTDFRASDAKPDWWSNEYSFDSCREAIERREQGISDAPSGSDDSESEQEKGEEERGQGQELEEESEEETQKRGSKGKGREREQGKEREKEKETQRGQRRDAADVETTEGGRGEGCGSAAGVEATRLPETDNPSPAEIASPQTQGAMGIDPELGGNVGSSGSKEVASAVAPSPSPGGPGAAAVDDTDSSSRADLESLARGLNLNQVGQKRPHEGEDGRDEEGRKRPPPPEASQGNSSVLPSQVEMVRALMPDIFTNDLSETTVALVEGPGVDGAETNSWLDGLFSFSRSPRAAAAGFTEWYIDQWPYKGWDNSALIGGARQLLLDEEVLLTTMDNIPMVGMMELFAGAVVMPDDARGYLQRRLVARISLLARDSVLKPPYMELWLHIMRVVRDWKESLSKDTGRDVSVPVFDRRLFDRSIDSSRNLPN